MATFALKQEPARPWMSAYKPILWKWASEYSPNILAGETGLAVTDVRVPTAAELLAYANLSSDDVLVVHSPVTAGTWPKGQTVEIVGTNLYDGIWFVDKEIDTTLTVIGATYAGDDTGLSGATISKYYNYYRVIAEVTMEGDPNTPRKFPLVKGPDGWFTLDVSQYARDNFKDLFKVASPGMDGTVSAIPKGPTYITQRYTISVYHRYDVPDDDGVPVSTEISKGVALDYGPGYAVNAVQPYQHQNKAGTVDHKWLDELADYEVNLTAAGRAMFLTYGPRSGQLVRPGEDFYLCFLWTKAEGTPIWVRLRTFDATGTLIAQTDIARTTPLNSGILAVGPGNLGVLITSLTETYTIALHPATVSGGADLTELFTFKVDRTCSEVARRFFCVNPLGGIDQFTSKGREKAVNSVRRSIATKPDMAVTALEFGTGDYNRQVWKTELLRRFQLTSHLVSPTELHWLYDSLFPQPNIKVSADGVYWNEVLLMNDDHMGPSSRDQHERLRLEYSLGTGNVTLQR